MKSKFILKLIRGFFGCICEIIDLKNGFTKAFMFVSRYEMIDLDFSCVTSLCLQSAGDMTFKLNRRRGRISAFVAFNHI